MHCHGFFKSILFTVIDVCLGHFVRSYKPCSVCATSHCSVCVCVCVCARTCVCVCMCVCSCVHVALLCC